MFGLGDASGPCKMSRRCRKKKMTQNLRSAVLFLRDKKMTLVSLTKSGTKTLIQ